MATYEYNGLMTVKDAAGNKYLLYPITKAECVDGLEEALAAKAAATHHHAAGDVNSGIFDSARIPNLDASKIASGTMAAARLPTMAVNKGGTGKTSWSANRLIYPSASTTLAQLAFPSVAGSVLRQGASGAPYWTSLQDLVAALGDAGGVRIATGSYTGTGTYGANNPCSLTFDFSPQIVMITIHEINSASSQPLISGPWIRGMSKGRLIVQPVAYSNDNYVNLTWNGNALSFYSTKDANYQLNLKDGIYHFFAIG